MFAPLPEISPSSPFQYTLLNTFRTQHSQTLPDSPNPTISQNKPSPPLSFLRSPFSSSSHHFLYPFPLPALQSASFNPLFALSHSSRAQRRTICSPTFWRLPTHARLVLLLKFKLARKVSSIPLTLFAYKHVLHPQAQTCSAFTTQILHFLLFHYAAQCTHIPFLCSMGRASHIRTATRFRAPPATTTTPSFHCFTLRALTCLAPRTSPSSLAILSLAFSSTFFSSSFFLAISSLFSRFRFPGSYSLSSKALWLST